MEDSESGSTIGCAGSSRQVRYPEVRIAWGVPPTGGYGNKLSLSNLSYIGVYPLRRMPLPGCCSAGYCQTSLVSAWNPRRWSVLPVPAIRSFAETPAIPVSCSDLESPDNRCYGSPPHIRFISDLFGIYNQFPFFPLMRGAEQSIMFPICSTKLLKLSGSPP